MNESEKGVVGTATDFIVWLFCVCSTVLSLFLLAIGTYYIAYDPNLLNLIPYLAAALTLSLHYFIRYMYIDES